MKLHEAFPSKYLKASDIPFPRTMKIMGVRMEEMGQDKQKKFVLYLENEPKGYVFGVTVWAQIANVLGTDESDHWSGKLIELFQDVTRNPAGQTVPCIRVRQPNTMAPQRLQPPQQSPQFPPQQPQAAPPVQGQASSSTSPWSPVAGLPDEIPDPDYPPQVGRASRPA